MIAYISWQDFHMRFLKTADLVFVLEDEYSWTFYSHNGPIVVKSVVAKKEEGENIGFVERYINGFNVVKLASAEEQLSVKFSMYQEQ